MDLTKSHPGFWNMPGLENKLFKHKPISYNKIPPAGISNKRNIFEVSILTVAACNRHRLGLGSQGFYWP